MANLLLFWGPTQGVWIQLPALNPIRVACAERGPRIWAPIRRFAPRITVDRRICRTLAKSARAIKPNDAEGILQVDVSSKQAFCWKTPPGPRRPAAFMRVVLGFVPIDGAFSLTKHACAHLERQKSSPSVDRCARKPTKQTIRRVLSPCARLF